MLEVLEIGRAWVSVYSVRVGVTVDHHSFGLSCGMARTCTLIAPWCHIEVDGAVFEDGRREAKP